MLKEGAILTIVGNLLRTTKAEAAPALTTARFRDVYGVCNRELLTECTFPKLATRASRRAYRALGVWVSWPGFRPTGHSSSIQEQSLRFHEDCWIGQTITGYGWCGGGVATPTLLDRNRPTSRCFIIATILPVVSPSSRDQDQSGRDLESPSFSNSKSPQESVR